MQPPQQWRGGVRMYREPLVTPQLEIGQFTYHGDDLKYKTWAPGEKIIIGAFCSIAHGVSINVGGGHGPELVSTFPFDYFFLNRPKPHRTYRTTPHTVIGSDVWIGASATILSGVQIGSGAIIGSCAVVASDVAPYTIVAGNPARPIRCRFESPVVERLLRIEWWNWDEATIRSRIEWFYRPIADFIAEFDRPQAAA